MVVASTSDVSTNTETELQSLLSGEVAAAETYTQAIDKLPAQHQPLLRTLCQEHGDAIKFFHKELSKRGVEPKTTSGMWGQFVKILEGSALMVSNKLALQALHAGEKRGLAGYQHAVRNVNLPSQCRIHIDGELVPAQKRHVDSLEQVLQQQ